MAPWSIMPTSWNAMRIGAVKFLGLRETGNLMKSDSPRLDIRLAETPRDLRAAQRLRYEVFVTELGADGPMVDHVNRLERDAFDPFYDHMILVDPMIDPVTERHVVGVYRLMTEARAVAAGGFYSESEYDLTRLKDSGRRLLELGRSCVASDLREIGRAHV